MKSLRGLLGRNALPRQALCHPTFPRAPQRSITRNLATSRPSSRIPLQSPVLHRSPLRLQHRSRPLALPTRLRRRLFASAPSPPSSDAKPLTISQRLRKLTREYGWSAVGIYFLLSALDFPFCFLAVRWVGTDTIGRWEHTIVETVKDAVKWPLTRGAAEGDAQEDVKLVMGEKEGNSPGNMKSEVGLLALMKKNDKEVYDHGYDEAEKANEGEGASIWTQLALAYAIHKSFMFIRVPLAAAVTPKAVKILRGWGWDIGKRRPKGIRGPEK